MLYAMMGWFIMFIVGVAVSLMTTSPDQDDINLLVFAPFIRKHVRKRIRKAKSAQRHLLREVPYENNQVSQDRRNI